MKNFSNETNLHLYQPVSFQSSDGGWHPSFNEALQHSDCQLTFDAAAILSLISFGYICGDRTLVKEIKRKPWLSDLDQNEKPVLLPIPEHHRYWERTEAISETFGKLLYEEISNVCTGRKNIYILLSGGLDSRVTAGVVRQIFRDGKLNAKPICVTWGDSNSRDVVYGRQTAELLGFEWIHIPLEAKDLLNNLKISAETLGAMVAPFHLHRMDWFENVHPDSIVLASIYGDMIGRAEFSKSHLLELRPLSPVNAYDLLTLEAFSVASNNLFMDLKALRDRASFVPRYVSCEHEMAGHYLRSVLAYSMSLIDQYCTVYQIFTHPKVYKYMWSLHPAIRDDDIYTALLRRLDSKLLSIPWSRTNRSIAGKVVKGDAQLHPSFHNYNDWITGSLYDALIEYINLDWVESTGLFQVNQIEKLCEMVRNGKTNPQFINSYDIFLWLATLKHFAEWCEKQGIFIKPELAPQELGITNSAHPAPKLRAYLRSNPHLYKNYKLLRQKFLRYWSLIKYPYEKPY